VTFLSYTYKFWKNAILFRISLVL